MIRRWPIRIRLTAAFTLMMALVLAGAAIGTVSNSRVSLDESITESLHYRLRDVQSATATAAPILTGGRDTAEQILDGGHVVASSREVAGQSLLSLPESATAEHGLIMVERPRAGTLPGPVRIAAAPTGGSRVAVAAVSLADRDAAVADLAEELGVAFPLVLIAAAAGAYLLAAGSLRSVERMRARAAAITADHPEQRLPLPASQDEISRLGATFNDLLARLHTALSRERQFVADASHELRTPLSLLTTELELAVQRPRTREELTAALHSALEETERLSRLAQDLLLLARTDHASKEHRAAAVELQPLLRSIVDRFGATEHQVTLECPPGLTVNASRDDVDRAVSNLLDNAIQHAGFPADIRAQWTVSGVSIAVCDHGPGLDPAFLPHAFDRFTRADTARTSGGAGLGLSITAALAQRNGGHVTAANNDVAGAVFTLTLPGIPAPDSQSEV